MPSIFGENIFDDFMESFDHFQGNDLMRTDVKESDGSYEVTMNIPGVRKEDVNAKLEDGYLSVNVSANTSKDEKDKNGNYIRRERYSGSASRSFYVGTEVTQEDIKAKFENGTLKLIIPKKESTPKVENKQYIAIEG